MPNQTISLPLPPRFVQPLPFVVRQACTADDLRRVAQLRANAYGRHLPAFSQSLRSIEAADLSADTVVLLAQSKADGRTIGTVRMQVNRERPLPLQASVALPASFVDGGPLIEATRLAVESGALGAQACSALLKSAMLHGMAAKAAWIIATARRPLDRVYRSLLFRDVFDQGQPLPMRHVGNLPHHILALPLGEVHALSGGHRLAQYMFGTEHPDLLIDASRLSAGAPLAA